MIHSQIQPCPPRRIPCHPFLVFTLLAVSLLAFFSSAQGAETTSGFDHFATGFPLTGRHELIDCAECHIAGQFKGTPMQCSFCHNEIRAPGKGAQHVPSSLFCDDCHTEQSWSGARFDHIGIQRACLSCHNNSIAIGKSATHILSRAICEDCHNTITFNRVARVDHTSVIGLCSSCHNGAIATGKHPTHLPTTFECDQCHTTNTWFGARFNHSTATGACTRCHNGTIATGKAANHIFTTLDCGNCHQTTGWLPAITP